METISEKNQYYWISVSENFSVFNSIEISVLNIFNIQYFGIFKYFWYFGIPTPTLLYT